LKGATTEQKRKLDKSNPILQKLNTKKDAFLSDGKEPKEEDDDIIKEKLPTDDADPIGDDASLGTDDDFIGDDFFIPIDAKPTLKYGAAWKKEKTTQLVRMAITHGFRHVDTACQPKHYNEAAVGEGWKLAASDLGLVREDIWLQTKYTSVSGQDPNNIPYNPHAALSEQVRQSVAKSLSNLQTTYIDSLVMHGMENSWDKTLEVYRTMEEFVDDGTVRQIGISNCYQLDALKYLYENARIKPKVVQNRFYRDANYDIKIRQFCQERGIEYQSFWTLTAPGNREAWYSNANVAHYAASKKLSTANIFYAFVLQLGISPLDGSTNEDHIEEDVLLMKRIRNGEQILDVEEMRSIATSLGFSLEDFAPHLTFQR